jgi:isovaleryl-CoA dehydrogenase
MRQMSLQDIFSNSLDPLVSTAREIARTVTAVHAEADDRDARWPAETMQALAAAGLMGLNVPESSGGLGQGMRGLVAISEVLARESASAGLCFAMHCVGTAVIAAKATDEHRQRYLEPIARGEHITTLALSEPGTGAFFFYPQLAATPTDAGFDLTGTKGFVTNGGQADSYVVSTAPFQGDREDGQFSCVLVDRDLPGLTWESQWAGFGMRSNDSRAMHLEHVHVPAGNLLGRPGDQLWFVFEVVAPYFLMAMAGTYLGVAQSAFDEARNRLGTRRYAHSGELLGSAPVVSHRLGDLWATLEATRQLVYSAAQQGDSGTPESLIAILACKAAAGDAAVHIANEAMTLCGGAAYRDNSRSARILRDARASHVMAPTTDMLKTWVGRALIGLPIL